ncbi:MAG: tyrosine-type recombinase/integrase [Lachnospiraceae bacterium]|nr:tyrosine-type recombinase/integrase [Lachnospiraceae bacterium]
MSKRNYPVGVYEKDGYLWVYVYDGSLKKNGKGRGGKQYATHLKANPENIPKAIEFRERKKEEIKYKKADYDAEMTLPELITRYMESKKNNADTTLSKLSYHANKLSSYFGEIKVRKIQVKDLEDFYSYLATKGNEGCGHKGEGLSKRTLTDVKKFVDSLFRLAVRKKVIDADKNPAEEAKIDESKITLFRRSSTDGYFNFEQAKYFLNLVKGTDLYIPYYCIIVFGLRREEMIGLKWSAVDFRVNHTLSVESTITRGSKVNHRDTAKTEGSQNFTYPFPLDDLQCSMFQQEFERQKEFRSAFGKKYIDNDYIFKNPDGSLHDPSYLTKQFRKILNSHPELPQKVTLHGLRKTTASILIVEQKKDIKSVQTWMRHDEVETTLRLYTQIQKEQANKETGKELASLFPAN